ncbi:MAG: signal peptidase II [Actinobacteria bacterium]|nr:MAG: signal peptidase II [Actinomycetota bacterium]
MTLRRPLLAFLLTVGFALVADQASKAMVRSALPAQDSTLLVPGVLYFTHVRNAGAAFGMLPGQRIAFMSVSVIVLLVIAVYFVRQRPQVALVVFGLGLIAAGAAGNLIDRATAGFVTDFLEFAFIDFPVFNIADSSIVIGAGLLIAWLLFAPAKQIETTTPEGVSASSELPVDSPE